MRDKLYARELKIKKTETFYSKKLGSSWLNLFINVEKLYHRARIMSTAKRWFKNISIEELLSISALEQFGPISWNRAYQNLSHYTELFNSNQEKLIQAGLTKIQIDAIRDRPKSAVAAKRLLESKGIHVITIEDKEYASLLKEINDPPLWIFYRGDLSVLSRPTLTVVGTRKPSAYAIIAIESLLAPSLIRQVTIVSGLAYGVDKKAHQISLANDSPTAAVLAGGLDSIYPTDHSRLADQIVENGGVLLTEYPPLSRPRPAKFPIRNRIIAGLSPVTIVVEAMIKSGSLTTSKAALDYNREVMAIPSDINRKSSGGTNFLIQQGATLLTQTEQITEELGLKKNAKKALPVDREDQLLLNLLTDRALTVDQLAALTKLEIPEILGILTHLELLGAVYQSQPGYYNLK